jgi:hypothetical protein
VYESVCSRHFISISHEASNNVVILNGVQNAKIENGEVYFSGYINTESSEFDFNGVRGNLCKLAVEENLYGDGDNGDDNLYGDGDNGDDNPDGDGDNGDDNLDGDGDNGEDDYQDDAYYKSDDDAQCGLQDGVYGFSTEITIPQYESRWSDTGWTDTGQVDMYTYGMVRIGSCEASVRLLSPIGPSAKTLFCVVLPLIGMLFVCIFTFFGIRMVIRHNRGLDFSKCGSKCGSRKSRGSKQSRKDTSKRSEKLQNDGATTSGTQKSGANETPAYQLMSENNADWVGTENELDVARLVA